MRLANHAGRATLVLDGTDGDTTVGVDLAAATDGVLGPDLRSTYDRWPEVLDRVATLDPTSVDPAARVSLDVARLGPPSPEPRQVFAIGVNYRSHAEETGIAVPSVPATFTKFPGCLTGPFGDVVLSGETVDWEIELVVVIGTEANHVAEADGWGPVAGVTVGQDISDRTVQFAAGNQFCLGKSYRTYGPTGPWLVTPDELSDRDDLGLRCRLGDELVQDARTSDMVFSVPQLIAELSTVVPLYPGDLIFTGTPAGVGLGRQPARFLAAGEVLESTIEGIGTIRNRMVAR